MEAHDLSTVSKRLVSGRRITERQRQLCGSLLAGLAMSNGWYDNASGINGRCVWTASSRADEGNWLKPGHESEMLKVMTIIGARPQFIKASSVSRALAAASGVTECIVHTGQHFDADMSNIFFDELGIPAPSHHLGVSGGGHGAMTGAMLQALEPLLEVERPDWVLVYGDTNSTLAGALAAAKLHIPVAHVEAGLRSFNRRMPEEQNRILTDHISDMLFTPTHTATARLLKEGIPVERISQVGDVMFDAALFFAERASDGRQILDRYELESKQYILATVHRAENTDDPVRLSAIVDALQHVAQTLPVVFPVHPRTRLAMEQYGIACEGVQLLEPVGYLGMVALECHAAVIATDSGGLQKEAYFHGIPCVTLRAETEWMELVELGWNRLAAPGQSDIAEIVKDAMNTEGKDAAPYGDGTAAIQITKELSRLGS